MSRSTKFRKMRDLISEMKIGHGCSVCGYDANPRALHYHHLPEFEKKHNISDMIYQGYSLDAILLEIKKCIVLCANCHSEVTDAEREGGTMVWNPGTSSFARETMRQITISSTEPALR